MITVAILNMTKASGFLPHLVLRHGLYCLAGAFIEFLIDLSHVWLELAVFILAYLQHRQWHYFRRFMLHTVK